MLSLLPRSNYMAFKVSRSLCSYTTWLTVVFIFFIPVQTTQLTRDRGPNITRSLTMRNLQLIWSPNYMWSQKHTNFRHKQALCVGLAKQKNIYRMTGLAHVTSMDRLPCKQTYRVCICCISIPCFRLKYCQKFSFTLCSLICCSCHWLSLNI